jgi:phosphoserine phosphatase RsbU/P
VRKLQLTGITQYATFTVEDIFGYFLQSSYFTRSLSMSLRKKWTLLLLGIVLIPLALSRGFYTQSTWHLTNQLGETIHKILVNDAKQQLVSIVDDFTRFSNQKRTTLNLALRLQARAVERLLAESPTDKTITDDQDAIKKLPPLANPKSPFLYYKIGADGKHEPIDVSYDKQSAYLLDNDDSTPSQKLKAKQDLNRLANLTNDYRLIQNQLQNDLLWQYTALESGVYTDYPGESSPMDLKDYKPLERHWYKNAKKLNRLSWSTPTIDFSTGLTVFSISMPVYYPDGRFAGVTGFDLASANLFNSLILPPSWDDGSTKMLVLPFNGRLVILDHSDYNRIRHDWRSTLRLKTLTASNPKLLEKIQQISAGGKSGVIEMPYKGQKAFWAFGAAGPNRPFPLVIVPYRKVVEEADWIETRIHETTYSSIRSTGILCIIATIIIVIIAFRTARNTTRPIAKISEAAKKLAEGRFDEVNAKVETGDELESLAKVVNDAGHKLRDRQRMKQALAIAMEVQQRLLPSKSPDSDQFDIAGKSLYCDETGGDYFDFVDLDHDKVGIALGDVSGHGIAAAMLMASFRGALRSHAETLSDMPEELLMVLNRYLLHDTGSDQFITVFYGVIDPNQMTITWSSAGHDPAILLRKADHEIELIEMPSTGLPLGIVDRGDYERGGPIKLLSGDLILAGTDGIWETANESGESFGKDRLIEILRKSLDEPAKAVRDKIVQSVTNFRGNAPQTDDITLVVIKVS